MICIDWQVDFCGKGGYVDAMGYDLELTRAGLEPTAAGPRRACGPRLHGHPHPRGAPARPRRLPAEQAVAVQVRSARASATRARSGRILVRGEPGWEIVPEVAPLDGEPIIDKPGKGSFYATDLDLLLRTRGITHIILTGITTDVCVHTTMRDANDRGYECLLLIGLHRRDRLRQLPGRAEDGDDAGRRLRRARAVLRTARGPGRTPARAREPGCRASDAQRRELGSNMRWPDVSAGDGDPVLDTGFSRAARHPSPCSDRAR